MAINWIFMIERVKRFGNQKPTQSVVLKYVEKRSKFKEAIELHEKTRLKAYKWQYNLMAPI